MRNPITSGRYAVVTSTLALVLALSGTAYAVATVRSADIVDGTIQGVDVHPSTIGGGKVINGSLTGADIRNLSIHPADIATNGVDTFNIADHTITSTDLAPGQVSPALFARLNSAGMSLGDAGVVSTSRSSTGVYTVQFVVPVTSCALLATPSGAFTGDSDVVSVSGATVTISNTSTAGTLVDNGLSVAALC